MAATHRLDEPGVGGDPHDGLGNGRTGGGATSHVEMRRDDFWGYITRVCNCEFPEYIRVRDFFLSNERWPAYAWEGIGFWKPESTTLGMKVVCLNPHR